MKNYVLGLLIVLAASVAIGQTSVGYSNTQNIQPLIQYRLPDWGYTNIFLDFDFWGTSMTTGPKETSMNVNFRPHFTRYVESEQRIGKFSFRPDVSYDYQKYPELSNPTRETTRLRYTLDISWYQYISGDIFLAFDGSSFGNSYHYNYSEDIKSWSIQSSPVFGVGWGRIRNVSPMLRALRFEERYSSVNSGPDFSTADRQTIARILAQERGYNAIHDRSRKYFWDDFYQEMPSLQSGLTPYDYFYLNEVFQENLGDRYEGWDIRLLFEYTNRQRKSDHSSVSIDPSGGISLRYRLFKNLNLANQIEVRGMLHYQSWLKQNSLIKDLFKTNDFDFHAILGHLWVISDRFLLNTTLAGMFPLVESEINYYQPEYQLLNIGPADWWLTQEGFRVQTVLSYFIEDQISVNTNLAYNSAKVNDATNEFWSCSLTISYYIFRNRY